MDIHVNKLEVSFIQLFADFLLIEQKIVHNTVAKYCLNLNRLFNFFKDRGLINANPLSGFRVKYKDSDRAYLTTSELSIIEEKLFLTNRLQVVKDLFIFQCYTGLSFSDMANLGLRQSVQSLLI